MQATLELDVALHGRSRYWEIEPPLHTSTDPSPRHLGAHSYFGKAACSYELPFIVIPPLKPVVDAEPSHLA